MGIVGRLLVLFAVLLMPLGMEPAAAANHYATMTGAAMEHCPGHSGNRQHNDGLATCSMPCASALPAQEMVSDAMPTRSPQLLILVTGQPLHGLDPEIATPPPKLA